MIKNEIKFFLNKKNLLCFLIGIISILLIYQFYYIKEYNNYSKTRLTELEENAKDIDTYAKAYQVRLERIRKEYPGHPKTAEAELMARVWSTYSIMNKNLQTYWKWPSRYEKDIRKAEILLDQQLTEVSKQQIEVGITNLYRNTEREWKQRMLLMDAYDKTHQEVPINKVTPTGAYVLNHTLSGINMVFLVVIFLMIIWNFDSWNIEFEQATYKVIFLLPYSRKRLFLIRFLTRFILSMIGILILLGTLFIRASSQFGVGLENYVIINSTATKTLGFFHTTWKTLMESDKIVSIGHSILVNASYMMLFLLFFLVLMHFLSFVIKNQMGTLLVIAVGMISVVTYIFYPKDNLKVEFNPLLYVQSGNAFQGALGIGIPLMSLILTIYIFVILIITMVWFDKCEL